VHDLTISLVQADLAWQDPDANRAQLTALLDTAPALGELVILPEMFTTGFTMRAPAHAETMAGPGVGWLRDEARRRGVTLCGSLIIESGGQFFNRLVWMPPDGVAGWYDKRHLFRMAGEHRHYTAGTERRVFRIGDWRICPLICYDLRFPVWSRGANAFDLLLYVANWPVGRRPAWQALLPARAVENQCYVAGVNRVGTDGQNVGYAGDSGVHHPLGHALLDLGSGTGVGTVRLAGDELVAYRDRFPAWQDADPFTLAPPPPAD
jgi:predicted amidohydrolase